MSMKDGDVWEEKYKAAIVETDAEKLANRVKEAKAAIDARIKELHLDHGGTPEERRAISDALAGLNVLRREVESRPHVGGLSNA
jgi:hypothetical protein